MRVSTVIINTKNGAVLINESDYDKEIHDLFVAESDAGELPNGGGAEVELPNAGTVAWYKLQLDNDGVDYPGDANKATLKMILDGSRA